MTTDIYPAMINQNLKKQEIETRIRNILIAEFSGFNLNEPLWHQFDSLGLVHFIDLIEKSFLVEIYPQEIDSTYFCGISEISELIYQKINKV